MFRAAAVAEVSAQLGKSLLKFCSGDVEPEGVLPDTQLLEPLLREASTAPLAQPPGKGMDGESGVHAPPPKLSLSPQPPGPTPIPNSRISCRSTLLHLHIGDHGAAQGRHHRAQQVRARALPQPWRTTPGGLSSRTPSPSSCWGLGGLWIPTQ